jgi:hypothetical protein
MSFFLNSRQGVFLQLGGEREVNSFLRNVTQGLEIGGLYEPSGSIKGGEFLDQLSDY